MALDDSLKQRIIGAIVLISCAVIFIPMVFDPESAEHFELKSGIPDAPPMPTVSIEHAVRPEITKTIHVEPRQAYRLIEDPQDQVIEEVDRPPVEEAAKSSVSSAEPPVEPSPSVKPEVVKKSQILGEDGLPRAWVVQVASFKEKQRANDLRKKLLDKGYRAFTRSSRLAGKYNTRVYVGPKVDKGQADEIKRTLDKDLKVTSMVLRFRPEG